MDRLKGAASAGMDKAKSIKKPTFGSAGSSAGSSSSPAGGSSLTGLGLRNKGRAQVAGLMGKSDDSAASERHARPLRELRDPASFPPPPKRTGTAGSAASAESQSPTYRPTDEAQRRDGPALPDRAGAAKTAPPAVPPRLPPRNGSFPEPRAVSDDDARTTGGLDQRALGRLGASGISVAGFGIGPSASAAGSPPPPPPPRPGIEGLGDRFSKLSTSSAESAPAAGTSFAEKQAAVKTANSFYKNPGSVSLKDGLAAAKTAQNFQQRHGDQVSAGVRSAREVNDKYGVSEKLGGPALPPPPPRRAGTESSPSPPLPARSPSAPSPAPSARTASPLANGLGAKKKPPPPPPKKADALAGQKPPPPPVPRSTRPSAASPPASAASLPNAGLPPSLAAELPQDLDLALQTEWFASDSPHLPRSLASINDKMLISSSSWERTPSGRTKHTLILAVRWTANLSTTKIKITWDAALPGRTAAAEQRHFPPPPPLPLSELDAAATAIGARVAAWCHAQMGQQVGDGECWTLAHDALAATPGAFVSQGYTHGACIHAYSPPEAPRKAAPLRPGDVLQFWRARFEERDAAGRVHRWSVAGDPDHTAVVTGAVAHGDSLVVEVLEQNVGGVRIVQRGEYRLGEELREGRVRAFRPVGVEYASFDAEWTD